MEQLHPEVAGQGARRLAEADREEEAKDDLAHDQRQRQGSQEGQRRGAQSARLARR
jgi:hypothetical protein